MPALLDSWVKSVARGRRRRRRSHIGPPAVRGPGGQPPPGRRDAAPSRAVMVIAHQVCEWRDSDRGYGVRTRTRPWLTLLSERLDALVSLVRTSPAAVLCRRRCRAALRLRLRRATTARASPRPTRLLGEGASASSRPRRASSRRRRASSTTLRRRRARPATQRGGPRRDTTRLPRRATDTPSPPLPQTNDLVRRRENVGRLAAVRH